MEKIKLIAFSTKNHVGLVNYKKSIEQQNDSWDLIVFGENVKWEGWRTRMKCYYDIANSFPSDELLVFTDAYDVLCLQPSTGFKEIFESFKTNIVSGAESGCDEVGNCYPPKKWWAYHNFPITTCANKYVNGGLFCGKAGSIAHLWSWCLKENYDDDQIALGHFMDTFPDQITLDSNNKLFFNDDNGRKKYTFMPDKTIIRDNILYKPYFIHFPGINLYESVPFFHLFTPSELFKVGPNYKKIGNQVIGPNEMITEFPSDSRGIQTGTIIEKSALYGSLFLFFIIFIALLIARKRK